MKTKLLVPLALTLLITLSAYSQNSEQQRGVVLLIDGESINDETAELTELFKITESQYFKDPNAPRFLLADRDGRVAFGIGGYIKTTLSYDFAGIADNVDFITYDIPIPKSPTDRSQFQMDASTSKLFFKLVGKTKSMGHYTAYIETDFRGEDYSLTLRHAYISFKSLLVGQTWSTFSDLAAAPPTIDFQGPSAETAMRNVQIRYTLNVRDKWQMAMSVENPDVSATTTTFTTVAKQRCPDIPIYIQYGWNSTSHIRLTGVMRGMRYRDEIYDVNRSVFGWGLQLSGTATIRDKWQLYYQVTSGQGISRYINDLGGENLDLLPSTADGKLKAPMVSGVVGGVQYNYTDKVFSTVSYSYVLMQEEDDIEYREDEYKLGQYLVANTFYSPNSSWQFGVEYLYGRRKNQDNQFAIANRAQIMAQYNF